MMPPQPLVLHYDRQLQARVRHLVSLTPRSLERDVDTLAVRCRDRIDTTCVIHTPC
jgi:hypothetical protein